MLKWLARQRQQLHGFYRDGFGRAFGMTALAFAVVMVVSYLVTLRYPAPIERLIELFREQIADRGIVDAEGNFSAPALFLISRPASWLWAMDSSRFCICLRCPWASTP